MLWRVFAFGCVASVVACGGSAAPEQRAQLAAGGGAEAAAGSAVTTEAGRPSVVAGGSGGAEQPATAGAAGVESAAGSVGVGGSSGGSTSVAGSASGGSATGGAAPGGAGGMSIGGAAGSAGSAGAWSPPDPDCQPSNAHALPLKCRPPDPIDCQLPGSGDAVCTGGYGACPVSDAPSGLYCHPYTGTDYSLCPPTEPGKSGSLRTCPIGTCGTDAGASCSQTTVVDGKYEFCPCVQFGGTAPYKCGENGSKCPPGAMP
jgi:hypothetical protein